MSDDQGLIEATKHVFGGAGLTIISAFIGRVMWHVMEVRKRNRKFFGQELLWEIPVAIGMAFIGEGVSAYFQVDDSVRVAVVATLAYLGPRGFETIFTAWVNTRIKK